MNEPRPVQPLHPPQQPHHPQQSGQRPPGSPPLPGAGSLASATKVPLMPPPRAHDPHLDSIALVDDEPAALHGGAPSSAAPGSKIKMQMLGISQLHHRTEFKRPTSVSGTGACRVRSFHGRLSDEGMAFMDDKINEWLDAHPDIEVKLVTTTVGMYDGKIKEEALVVNVWY